MNYPLGPITLALLALPALALTIARRIFFGRTRAVADDPMQILLSVASTIMFVIAALGTLLGMIGAWVLFLPLPIALVVLLLLVLDRTRRSEHRGLVWALASAASRGIPLPEAARAFADETPGNTGKRAMRLAQALEQGQSLAAASRTARLRMNTDMRLTVAMAEPLGMLGPAMRQQLDDSHQIDSTLRDGIGRFVYIGIVITFMLIVVTFVMWKIVPVLQMIFKEFGVKVPELTQRIFDLSQYINRTGWYFGFAYVVVMVLAGFLMFAVELYYLIRGPRRTWIERRVFRVLLLLPIVWPLLILVVPIFFYIGWFPRNVPVFWRLFRRYDGALVMRGLALGLRRQLPLPAALRLVASTYPLSIIGRRLTTALSHVERGGDWRVALRRVGLIGEADAAVLAAAERAGNLEWALEEMAASALRRQSQRLQLALQITFPFALLVLGACVFVFVTGLFLPLITLIEGLA